MPGRGKRLVDRPSSKNPNSSPLGLFCRRAPYRRALPVTRGARLREATRPVIGSAMTPKSGPLLGVNSRVPAAGWLGILIGSAMTLLLGVGLFITFSDGVALTSFLVIYGSVATTVAAWHYKTTRPRPQCRRSPL